MTDSKNTKKGRSTSLSKKKEYTSVALSKIDSEVNLLKYPFFALSRADVKNKIITVYKEELINPEGNSQKYWQVTSNATYGYPGPFDRKVFRAIESILSELPKPIANPIKFTFYDLCKRMGISISGVNKLGIKEAIERIVATTVKAKGTFYSKDEGKVIADKSFHLYESVVFYGQEMPDGKMADSNYLFLNVFYLKSLNTFYVKSIDYNYLRSLKSPIAERLYELLGVKFYGAPPDNSAIRYLYSTLCDLLPVKRQKYLSLAQKNLKPAFKELLETSFFSHDPVWEKTKQKDDWYIYFYPGKRVREEKKNIIQPELDFEKPVSLSLSRAPINYMAAKTKKSSAASECVLYFYRRLYGNDEFNHDPTDKELELAEKYLQEIGNDALHDLIDETIEHAQRTNWEIRSFCSVKVIAPKKLADVLNRRRIEKRRESVSNERELKKAYEVFIDSAVIDFLNALPKNELDQIIEEEEKKVTEHWRPFSEGKKISDVPAMESEFEFNLKNRVKDLINVPSYEEWKTSREADSDLC